MRKQTFSAKLNVTLDGTGCKLCPALRYRMSDEKRFCSETGEVLEKWKTERGIYCTLTDIKEKTLITED